MEYRIEIRDRDFENAVILDKRAFGINWSYDQLGGCADMRFSVSSKYCTETDIGANFNVQVKRRNPDTKNYDLWYQGRIEDIDNIVNGSEETISARAFGYQSELNDIIINETYASTEISAILKDILDTHVTPNTNISYDAGDIESTGYTATQFDFEYETAMDAIVKLAELVGYEWGVDADRKLYFKAKSEVTGFRYPIGPKLRNMNISSTSKELINRVIILGGDVAGSQFVFTKDYDKNQAKYNRRDRAINNSSIVNNTDATQLADTVQAAHNTIPDRVRVELLDEVHIEETKPIGLFDIISVEPTYVGDDTVQEPKYNTVLYAGVEPFRVQKANYSIDSNSNLLIRLTLGNPLPTEARKLKKLEFEINQLRQAVA